MSQFEYINDGPPSDSNTYIGPGLLLDQETPALYVIGKSGQPVSASGGLVGLQSTITAAATITPTGAVAHLTGTTAVETITATDVPVGSTFTLIPDAASGQTLGTSGNIGAGVTLVQNQACILTWDGTHWWPSYLGS